MGIILLGIGFFAPDRGRHHLSFVQAALNSVWHRPLELAAAWGSVRIILISIGLFLLFESLGTMLARCHKAELAAAVYSLEIIAVLGYLFGTYYLNKAVI
jgi:hypothetical protein